MTFYFSTHDVNNYWHFLLKMPFSLERKHKNYRSDGRAEGDSPRVWDLKTCLKGAQCDVRRDSSRKVVRRIKTGCLSSAPAGSTHPPSPHGAERVLLQESMHVLFSANIQSGRPDRVLCLKGRKRHTKKSYLHWKTESYKVKRPVIQEKKIL